LFVLAALLLAGVPLSGAGLGKALLEESGHSRMVAALVVLVSACTAGAVLRAGLRIFFGLGRRPRTADDGEETTGAHEHADLTVPPGPTPPTMLIAIVLLLGSAVALGIPNRALARAAAAFCDGRAYRDYALTGRIPASVLTEPQVDWTSAGVTLGLVSTALALVVAVIGLFAPSVDRPLLGLRRLLRATTGILHRAHSGHLGDYTAWLLTGTAFVAMLLLTG
jgi:multicomponent Na+:H+ antiporter subunit D